MRYVEGGEGIVGICAYCGFLGDSGWGFGESVVGMGG